MLARFLRRAALLGASAFIAQCLLVAAPIADTQTPYLIGDTREGPVTLTVSHWYNGSLDNPLIVTLKIVAEGVDSNASAPYPNETDAVYFNGNFLGYLTGQGFYFSGYAVLPGAGAHGAPVSGLSTSIFAINPAWVRVGANLVDVVVDPHGWIMEWEVSELALATRDIPTEAPEPASVALAAAGLCVVGALRRIRRA